MAPRVPPIRSFEASASRLIERSMSAGANRYAGFAWSAPAPDRLAMSPAFTPLAGHPVYQELNDERRWQLALLEAVSFFSLNISGERDLMRGLEARVAGVVPEHVSRYLPCFLREEAAHTEVFKRFCHTYGGFIFRDRQVRFPQEFLPGEENFVFFARALIFEEIADFYNRKLAADDTLWLLVRDIHRYHAEDEARHIAFGRLYVSTLWDELGKHWTVGRRRASAAPLNGICTACNAYTSMPMYTKRSEWRPRCAKRSCDPAIGRRSPGNPLESSPAGLAVSVFPYECDAVTSGVAASHYHGLARCLGGLTAARE